MASHLLLLSHSLAMAKQVRSSAIHSWLRGFKGEREETQNGGGCSETCLVSGSVWRYKNKCGPSCSCWQPEVLDWKSSYQGTNIFFFLTESIPQKKVGFEGFLKIRHRSKGVVETCSHLQQVPDVVKKAITSPQQLGTIHHVSFPLVTFVSNYFIPGMKFLVSCYWDLIIW